MHLLNLYRLAVHHTGVEAARTLTAQKTAAEINVRRSGNRRAETNLINGKCSAKKNNKHLFQLSELLFQLSFPFQNTQLERQKRYMVWSERQALCNFIQIEEISMQNR